jgi:hypothetical protein
MSESFLELLGSMDIVLKKFAMSVLQDCSGRRHPTELSSQRRRKTWQVINHLRTTGSSAGRQWYAHGFGVKQEILVYQSLIPTVVLPSFLPCCQDLFYKE